MALRETNGNSLKIFPGEVSERAITPRGKRGVCIHPAAEGMIRGDGRMKERMDWLIDTGMTGIVVPRQKKANRGSRILRMEVGGVNETTDGEISFWMRMKADRSGSGVGRREKGHVQRTRDQRSRVAERHMTDCPLPSIPEFLFTQMSLKSK